MTLTGELLIGAAAQRGSEAALRGVDPASGQALEPPYRRRVGAPTSSAPARSRGRRSTLPRDLPRRARALPRGVAGEIMGQGDALIERAMPETGLPRARLEGERAPHGRASSGCSPRSCAREAGSRRASIRADPDRKPLAAPGPAPAPRRARPRRGVRREQLPARVLGRRRRHRVGARRRLPGHREGAPGASGHLGARGPRDPGGSQGVRSARGGLLAALRRAAARSGARWSPIRASRRSGFTGSRGGGLALMRIASERPEPIPVYAEMSSINPVLVLPAALAGARRRDRARRFVALADARRGTVLHQSRPGARRARARELDAFLRRRRERRSPATTAATMLTPGIRDAYSVGRRQAGGESRGRRRSPAARQGSGADLGRSRRCSRPTRAASSPITRCATRCSARRRC